MNGKTNSYRKHIAVYADGEAATYLLLRRLRETFAQSAVDVIEINRTHVLAGQFPNKNTLRFILPGTPKGSSGYRDQLGDKGFSAIQKWVEAGGEYEGYCAGAYLASAEFSYFDKYKKEMKSISPLLPLMEGRSSGPIPQYVDFQDTENPWSDYSLARIDFTNAAGQPDVAGIYYSSGPAMELYSGAKGNYEVLARFKDVPRQPIAALRRNNVGLGSATLISFPAEVGSVHSQMIKSNHPHAQAGYRLIEQLHPWEDSRKRFWVALNQPTFDKLTEQGLHHVKIA